MRGIISTRLAYGYICGAFFFFGLMIDVGIPIPLWEVPPRESGRRLYKTRAKQTRPASLEAELLCGICLSSCSQATALSSCPDFPQL